MKVNLGDRVSWEENETGLDGTVVGVGEFLFTGPKALVFGSGVDGHVGTRWVAVDRLTVDEKDGGLALVHGGYPTAVIGAV